MTVQPKPNDFTLSELATQAMNKAKGIVQDATEIMFNRVRRNAKLYRSVADPLVREACYDAVRAQSRATRRAAWTPNTSAEADRAGVEALGRGTLRQLTLLDFPLPGGKALGDATFEEVRAAFEFYSKQEDDMRHKKNWLRLILMQQPKNDDPDNPARIRQVLSAEQLSNLQIKAQKQND